MHFNQEMGFNPELLQEHRQIRRAIIEAAKVQVGIDRGDLPADQVPFSVRAEPYQLIMRRRPNPRDVERDFILEALDPKRGQIGLEIGSGGGFLTEALVKATRSTVLGVDPSFRQQGYLNEITRGLEEPYNRLVFPVSVRPDSPGLINFLRYLGYVERIDYATSLAALHHVADQRELFRNYAEVLKVGGVVVAADVAKGTRLWRMFTEFLPKYVVGGHEGTYLDEKEIKELCVGTPFEIEEIEERVMKWRPFEGEEDMAAFVAGLHGLNLPFKEIAKKVRRYLDFGYDQTTGQDTLYWDSLIRVKLRKTNRKWSRS